MLQAYPSSNEGGQKRKDDQIPHSRTHLCLPSPIFPLFLIRLLTDSFVRQRVPQANSPLNAGFHFRGKRADDFLRIKDALAFDEASF
jgi:hypothetical protein